MAESFFLQYTFINILVLYINMVDVAGLHDCISGADTFIQHKKNYQTLLNCPFTSGHIYAEWGYISVICPVIKVVSTALLIRYPENHTLSILIRP